ncbi:LCP family protein [Exiguobacterium sp. AM39-5BH]|uniref:LCP family protein n=1 Tax=Exiguobacterium sp. AM39-5BH TaxID=2292355 RepID=UPI000FE1BDF5|nr:LCP family protein [Exiguobacterium sp. AM39-5BH]RHB49740.1 LytR family transcriptional regulator [Exiguobacterium sp. AM39-5BH]
MEQDSRKKRPAWKIALLVLGLVLLIGGSAFGYFVYKANETAENANSELTRGDKSERRDETVDLTKDHFSVLLAGVDGGASLEEGRTDSLMVATFNKESRQVTLVSIPRDSYVDVVTTDGEFKDKINHAYSYGGIDTTIATVEKLFDIPVDYYATINFDGIEDLVDAVGGVEVDVLIPISGRATGNVELEPGVQTLNGKEALAYARMRKDDPEGDVGRAKRQQQVLEAIINEATTINSFTKLNRIMNAVGNNIRTNMSLSEASQLQPYTKSLRSFNQETLAGGDLTIDGVYYYELDPADLSKKRTLLKTELGLPVTAEDSENDTDNGLPDSNDGFSETTTY